MILYVYIARGRDWQPLGDENFMWAWTLVTLVICCSLKKISLKSDFIQLVVLQHWMLHTKFQGHQPFGSGEGFLSFLPYMGMAAILVMWLGPFEQTFVPPSHGDSIWNLASVGPVVSEEKMFKECGRWTDKGGLPIL